MKKIIALLVSLPIKILLRLRHGSHVKIGKGVILNHKFKFKGKGKLIIGDNCNLYAHEEPNRFMTFDRTTTITIGKNCRLNGVTIQSREKVEIGDNCLIGSSMLIDNDFHSIYPEHRNDPGHIKSAPIKVGKDCWLAGQSVILKGVSIGDRSVVALRAVVTKDVPTSSVVAGNPAHLVKEI